MDVKWYFTMLFICISLMINNIQYLFIYLSTTCMSSLKKCLFMYIFVPTLIQTFLVLILLNYEFSYIFCLQSFTRLWCVNIFSYVLGYLSPNGYCSLMQRNFNLKVVHFTCFLLLLLTDSVHQSETPTLHINSSEFYGHSWVQPGSHLRSKAATFVNV